MAQTAEIVIIGAGIVGCSVAYNLAKMGAQNIIVVEKENSIAQGSTGLSASGIRAQFSTEINIRLSLESMNILETFKEEVGYDPEFKHIGYLFLISTEKMLKVLKEAFQIQKKLGMRVEFLSPQEVKKSYPFLYVDDLISATFHQRDGYADPVAICTGYYKAAKKMGVTFLFDTETIGFETNRGHVAAINTSKGKIETPLVINASGPYANAVGKMANLHIPALPYRRIIAVTEPFKEIQNNIPLTIDTTTGVYFRKEGEGVLMGEADEAELSSFNLIVNWDFLEVIIEHAIRRVPVLKEAKIHRHTAWAGLYSITPDNHPIIGEAPELKGFINVVGFSGHGIMHSPAIGRCVAELIINGRSELVDISPLSIARFEGGKKGLIEHAAF
jgi:sarcosine oxidase subunit beta